VGQTPHLVHLDVMEQTKRSGDVLSSLVFLHIHPPSLPQFPNDMAPPKETKFKVAAAHAAPVYMNKAATIKKTVQLIEQAAADDIKLLVFPETFIPGYPVGSPCPCTMCSTTCDC
jgi:hypothetical protein